MLRKWTILMILAAFLAPLAAQPVDELTEEDLNEGIVQVNYEKKSVATAVLLSSLFPGAGQFYANPREWTTYVFPVIEIGLWVGFIHFDGKGGDKEDEYMDFADQHYIRSNQTTIESMMMAVHDEDIYDDKHFRLDGNNSQHYYEDIGKYDKYIFGWEDWYDIYAYNGNVEWAWDSGPEDKDHRWLGNYPTNPEYADQDYYDTPYSGLRAEYDDMRQEAEDFYDKADLFTFGVIANHIVSALDAVRVTRNYNIDYISKRPPIEFDVQTCMRNDRITPMLTLSHHF